MDFKSIKTSLQSIDWKKWLELIGPPLLYLVGIGIILFIAFSIFKWIFLTIIGLIVGAYEYISTREEKYYYAAAFLITLLILMALFRRVGLVSLSSQSLAHRRNLFLAFFLVFLIENFDLNVAEMFRASNDKINIAAKGILALFALYSFVEYVHNFLHDFLRSKNDSKIIENPRFLRAPRLVDAWLILIGNYRTLFDIALPVATSIFILVVYSKDIGTVFKSVKTMSQKK